MNILQITAHYHPNIGGVETHLSDLVSELSNRRYNVFVLTYSPLVVESSYKILENLGKRVRILRIPWPKGLFYKLINLPALEFLYLFPGLFLLTPLVFVYFKPNIVHAHGLVATTVSVFWGNIFFIKVITSTHSIYNFPKKGLYRNFCKIILNRCHKCICLSDQSARELLELGILKDKVGRFTYWVDLNHFKRNSKAKEVLRWKGVWILFVGRLIKEKGVLFLLKAVDKWDKDINLGIIGTGPLQSDILLAAKKNKRIHFFGPITQEKLPLYYSAADWVIVPSISEEGFGRVILESLGCGTPVIGSRRGAIPEAINEKVGILMDVSTANLVKNINFLKGNSSMNLIMSKASRAFAIKRYSNKNIEDIIRYYE